MNNEIEFERLISKIRRDGDGQHGASMVDVEKLIKIASMFMRLTPMLEQMANVFSGFDEAVAEMNSELDEGIF